MTGLFVLLLKPDQLLLPYARAVFVCSSAFWLDTNGHFRIQSFYMLGRVEEVGCCKLSYRRAALLNAVQALSLHCIHK